MTTTRSIVPGSWRRALAGAKALARANPHAKVEVLLKLRRKKKLPLPLGRPHPTTSRKAIAETYGAAQEDIDRVVKVFGALGLTLLQANAATRSVRLSGTVATMESVFSVKLVNYSHMSGNYRGLVGHIHVPGEVTGIVQGVFGLDNRRVVRRRRQPIRDSAVSKSLSGAPAGMYSPAQLASHYNFPKGDGAGQTIGLLEFGGGFFADDLRRFCDMVDVPPPIVKPISTDGTSTTAKDGAEGEVMLDIEVIAGICPKAMLAVYFANWTELGWITALDAALQDGVNDPGVLSVSWGAPEDTDIWTEQAISQVNEALAEAAHLGITVCIASGDDGSSDADLDGNAHVDFPASSPYVLSVGGTTVAAQGGTGADVVWKEGDGLRADNGGSTGGGVSAVFQRPVWQDGLDRIVSVNPGAILGRCIPDLSANADWNASPYLLVVDGSAQPNGGTSAASPLVAALITLINAERGAGKRVGFVTPVLYQKVGAQAVGALGCTDVESGDNITSHVGGYTAEPGYDAASGWGTPNGEELLKALNAALPS